MQYGNPLGTNIPMITIVPYQERWPEEFKAIALEIRKAVAGSALAIHHIGSTSIPLLAAKDVIDIQVTVSNLADSLQGRLMGLGFELGAHQLDHCPRGMRLGAEELAKRYFRGTGRRMNLHVRRAGAFNQRYAILFRDFLRENPVARDAYGEIKLQLARYFPANEDAYYDIKDPVCDALIAGALVWGKATRWEPRPTDA